jgi:hypothetical protein
MANIRMTVTNGQPFREKKCLRSWLHEALRDFRDTQQPHMDRSAIEKGLMQ